MAGEFSEQLSDSHSRETEDFERRVEFALYLLRQGRTRFFVKHGKEYIVKDGVISPASDVVRKLKQNTSFFQPHAAADVNYVALCRFIDESRAGLSEKSSIDLSRMSFSDKVEQVADLRAVEPLILFWQTKSGAGLEEINQDVDGFAEKIVLGKIYEQEMSTPVSNFPANFSDLMHHLAELRKQYSRSLHGLTYYPNQKKEYSKRYDEAKKDLERVNPVVKSMLRNMFDRLDLATFRHGWESSNASRPGSTATEKFLKKLYEFDPAKIGTAQESQFFVAEAFPVATNGIGGIEIFFNDLFTALAPFFHDDEHYASALVAYSPDKKEIYNESLFQDIKKTSHPEEKVERIKKYIEKIDGDFILQHLFEFNLSQKQEKEILLFIADKDPETIIHNIEHLDINDYGRQEVLDFLFAMVPVQLLAAAEKQNLGEHELENYLDRFVVERPLNFLETIRFILKRHDFPEAMMSRWESTLQTYIDTFVQPLDILPTLGHIDVYDMFPRLQEKIDHKIRDSIKRLGIEMYEQLLVLKNKEGQDFSSVNLEAEARKIIEQWGCPDYLAEILAFAGWQNGHAKDRVVAEWSNCEIPSYYFPEVQNLKRNANFLILEAVSTELAKGKEFVDDLEPMIQKSDKSYDNVLLEKLFEQLLARHDVASTTAYLFDIITALPLSKKEKSERFKRVIDQDPVALAMADFIKEVYDVFDDDIRVHFVNALAERNPFCLAENYARFAIHDRVREERIFKKMITSGVQPFARIDDVRILLPLLRVEALDFLWQDGGDPKKEKARNNLLKARESLSAKAWNFLLTQGRMDSLGDMSSFYENMTSESYAVFDAVVNRKGKLFEYLFELEERPNNLGGKGLADVARLKLLAFSQQNEDITRWEKLIEELDELHRAQKKKKGDGSPVFSDEHYLVAMIIAGSWGISMEETQEIISPFKDLLDVDTFLPEINPRRQIEFMQKHQVRVRQFLDNDLVAGDKRRIVRIILTAENPERKLVFLENFANNLDCALPVWEQLAVLSKGLILEQMSQNVFINQPIPLARESYMWQGFGAEEKSQLLSVGTEKDGLVWIAGTKFSPEQIKLLIQNRLRRTFEIDRDALESASLRNKNFAEAQEENLVLPLGTLLHFSHDDSAGEMLCLGNLCGECLGVKSKRDTYPYQVDTLRVQENVRERDIASILRTRLNYGGDWLFFYPFRDAADAFHRGEESPVDSVHFNHHLIFGALARTELGGIVFNKTKFKDKEERQAILESLKLDIVKNDIYIPVFDREGKLLFTHKEFTDLWQTQKPCASVEVFLSDDSQLDHLEIAGGGGHKHTVKEHSLLVEKKIMSAAVAQIISPRLQTVLRLAARLHDSGKTSVDGDVQEITNVVATKELLGKIRFLKVEDERLVLKFVRNDELLGEILKGMHFESGKWHLDKEGRDKLKKFKEIFANEEERRAMLLLYESDVRSIGGEEYNQWMVEEKLKELKLL